MMRFCLKFIPLALLPVGCAADDAVDATASMSEMEGWSLIWSDEFDGQSVDRSKWGFDIDCWGGGNDERQCYTDNVKNALLEDGKLVITAHQEESAGPALPPHLRKTAEDQTAINTKPFTSARLTTKGKASWRYGRIDVRAKLPQGQGTWPAIWMLPEDNDYGSWAASGEIDIMEAVNMGISCEKCPGGIENTIMATLHFGGLWPDNKMAGTEVPLVGSLEEFHTYSIIWSEGRFDWLVDGRHIATKTAKDWFTTASEDPDAPFDKPFHLILNLAIGGRLSEGRGAGGVSEGGFPKRFEVDFVRVWQCDDRPVNPHNCIDSGE